MPCNYYRVTLSKLEGSLRSLISLPLLQQRAAYLVVRHGLRSLLKLTFWVALKWHLAPLISGWDSHRSTGHKWKTALTPTHCTKVTTFGSLGRFSHRVNLAQRTTLCTLTFKIMLAKKHGAEGLQQEAHYYWTNSYIGSVLVIRNMLTPSASLHGSPLFSVQSPRTQVSHSWCALGTVN